MNHSKFDPKISPDLSLIHCSTLFMVFGALSYKWVSPKFSLSLLPRTIATTFRKMLKNTTKHFGKKTFEKVHSEFYMFSKLFSTNFEQVSLVATYCLLNIFNVQLSQVTKSIINWNKERSLSRHKPLLEKTALSFANVRDQRLQTKQRFPAFWPLIKASGNLWNFKVFCGLFKSCKALGIACCFSFKSKLIKTVWDFIFPSLNATAVIVL